MHTTQSCHGVATDFSTAPTHVCTLCSGHQNAAVFVLLTTPYWCCLFLSFYNTRECSTHIWTIFGTGVRQFCEPILTNVLPRTTIFATEPQTTIEKWETLRNHSMVTIQNYWKPLRNIGDHWEHWQPIRITRNYWEFIVFKHWERMVNQKLPCLLMKILHYLNARTI